MPQNPLRHLLLKLAKPLAHRYNKAVGRRAYCVGWRNKEVGGRPYCTDKEDKAKNLAYMTKRDLKSLVLPLFTIVLGKNFSMTKNLFSLRLSSHH